MGGGQSWSGTDVWWGSVVGGGLGRGLGGKRGSWALAALPGWLVVVVGGGWWLLAFGRCWWSVVVVGGR